MYKFYTNIFLAIAFLIILGSCILYRYWYKEQDRKQMERINDRTDSICKVQQDPAQEFQPNIYEYQVSLSKGGVVQSVDEDSFKEDDYGSEDKVGMDIQIV